jgi:hypothetical protein
MATSRAGRRYATVEKEHSRGAAKVKGLRKLSTYVVLLWKRS